MGITSEEIAVIFAIVGFLIFIIIALYPMLKDALDKDSTGLDPETMMLTENQL